MSFEELEMFRLMGFSDEQILKAAEQVEAEREYILYCETASKAHEGLE